MTITGTERVRSPCFSRRHTTPGGVRMSATVLPHVDPKDVLNALGRHMLVDGYHIVMDLKRSRGNMVYDALHDVEILDLFSQFATVPIGYAHPKMTTPEFLEELGWAAVT